MSFITAPFSWLLLQLYNPVQNFGIAIILFALVVKLIMLPFQIKSKKSMARMTSLNPIMKELEKKHGGNKQKYQQEVAKLYQEEKINPMSGCLWALIPLPIMLALYSVVREPLTHVMGIPADQITALISELSLLGITIDPQNAYAELEIAQHVDTYFAQLQAIAPGLLNLNYNFFGINLTAIPQWNILFTGVTPTGAEILLFFVPFVSGFFSWLSMKVSQSSQPSTGTENNPAAQSMKTTLMMMPLMSIWFAFIMPSAMGIYWIANSILIIIQELVFQKTIVKGIKAESDARTTRIQERLNEEEKRREEREKKREEGLTEKNKNTSKKKGEIEKKIREEERRAAERALEEATSGKVKELPPSQVGKRRYARGRDYDPNRYEYVAYDNGGAEPIAEIDDLLPEGKSTVDLPESQVSGDVSDVSPEEDI